MVAVALNHGDRKHAEKGGVGKHNVGHHHVARRSHDVALHHSCSTGHLYARHLVQYSLHAPVRSLYILVCSGKLFAKLHAYGEYAVGFVYRLVHAILLFSILPNDDDEHQAERKSQRIDERVSLVSRQKREIRLNGFNFKTHNLQFYIILFLKSHSP